VFPESSAHRNHTAAAAFCPDVTRRFDSERPPADKALVGPQGWSSVLGEPLGVRLFVWNLGNSRQKSWDTKPFQIPSRSFFLTTSGAERCVGPMRQSMRV